MNITRFQIDGPILIDVKCFGDERGFFTERYRQDQFSELGLPDFIQDNFSRSSAGILRGLHFQFEKPQSKLVTCVTGRIFDVAVDIRKSSKTFGKHITVELSGDKPQWLWIPAGFAHGFCVLGNQSADMLYKVNTYYNAKGEQAIQWNDSELNIQWPIESPVISAKDLAAKPFSDYKLAPKF